MKKMLQTPFGTYWKTEWVQVGFITPSLAMPSTIDGRLGLTLGMAAFFTKEPSYEVDQTKLTAAEGTRLHTAAVEARDAMLSASASLNEIGDDWSVSEESLKDGMHALIDNLERVLDDSDARWLRFGLQIPDRLTTPTAPENLAAQFDESGNLALSCDVNPRTERYRWRTRILGVQTEPILSSSTTEPMTVLTKFLPGQSVEIHVQAVLGNLQSVPSQPLVVVLPMPLTKAVELKVVAERVILPEMAIAETNGNGERAAHLLTNGTGNGQNGNHSR